MNALVMLFFIGFIYDIELQEKKNMKGSEKPYTKENKGIFCLRRLGLIASIGGAASSSSSTLDILYRVSIWCSYKRNNLLEVVYLL